MDQTNGTDVTLHLYTIEKPRWNQVNNNHIDSISGQIVEGGWVFVEGKRRGFLNCKRLENIVYGYYAQEGEIHIEQYDENQQLQSDQENSFERILFLLFLVEGMVVVQSTRISKYIDLSGPALRKGLFDALEVVFKRAGLVFRGRAVFERYKHEYTREQLIVIFESHSINRILVRDLQNSSVPRDLKLFNPNFDADEFLKSIIAGDLHLSDQIDWSGQDIQKTKIARGILHAGNPQIIEGLDEYGELREWEISTPETLSLEVNTNNVHFPEEDIQKILAFFRRKLGLFTERLAMLKHQQDEADDLPLFGQSPK